MASLRRIEQMTQSLLRQGVPYDETVPFWLAIDGGQFSGLLRSIANGMHGTNVVARDEDGMTHDLAGILDEAAERLDDAHEEWLENMW
jgi:hypothetical protein